MAQQQAQVDEVIGIMHKNVENVLERDRKLGDLEERADALQDGCAQFEKQAAAMKNKFWMENLKAIIAGSVVGLLVLGLIYWKFFMPQPPPPGYGPQPGGAPAGGDQGSTTQTRSHEHSRKTRLCFTHKIHYTTHPNPDTYTEIQTVDDGG